MVRMLRFRATYGRAIDFVRDVDEQVARGGLLVRVDLTDVERDQPVELEIVTPVGRLTLRATVLQNLPGAGLAIALDGAELRPLAEVARRAPEAPGPAPRFERLPVADEPASGSTADPASHAQQQAKKIQLALHGDKNQRMAILRENNKLLHGYVLRNPQIQLDEIVFIAKQTTAAVELLTAIANRREWIERPEVAIALVRNPKTPIPLAVRMLDHVGAAELRNLAKQSNVRDAIQRAARKKVLG
jgi:hypothetical protein